MVLGIGIDIIEIDRINNIIENKPKFINRFFTIKESLYFESRKNNSQIIAGNFAAKEAFVKAFGTGIRNLSLKEIEVLRDKLGKPYINLYGNALKISREKGINSIHISISHSRLYAVANVIVEDKLGHKKSI